MTAQVQIEKKLNNYYHDILKSSLQKVFYLSLLSRIDEIPKHFDTGLFY